MSFSDLLELAAAIARIWPWGIAMLGLGGLGAALWIRRGVRHSIEVLLLLRAVGIHMLQNRPPVEGNEQDERRAEQIFNWWDGETIKMLGKARASASEIAEFRDLGNISQATIIAEKLYRLHKIIRRLEGR